MCLEVGVKQKHAWFSSVCSLPLWLWKPGIHADRCQRGNRSSIYFWKKNTKKALQKIFYWKNFSACPNAGNACRGIQYVNLHRPIFTFRSFMGPVSFKKFTAVIPLCLHIWRYLVMLFCNFVIVRSWGSPSNRWCTLASAQWVQNGLHFFVLVLALITQIPLYFFSCAQVKQEI